MSPNVEVLSGGELLLRGTAAEGVGRLCRSAIRQAARTDGIAALPWLLELEAAAVLAVERADGMAVYRSSSPQPGLSCMDDLLTTTPAAQRLGISARAVRAACERGSLEAKRRKGQWLIPADEVIAYRERNPLD